MPFSGSRIPLENCIVLGTLCFIGHRHSGLGVATLAPQAHWESAWTATQVRSAHEKFEQSRHEMATPAALLHECPFELDCGLRGGCFELAGSLFGEVLQGSPHRSTYPSRASLQTPGPEATNSVAALLGCLEAWPNP